jgi:hypothetical protein
MIKDYLDKRLQCQVNGLGKKKVTKENSARWSKDKRNNFLTQFFAFISSSEKWNQQ